MIMFPSCTGNITSTMQMTQCQTAPTPHRLFSPLPPGRRFRSIEPSLPDTATASSPRPSGSSVLCCPPGTGTAPTIQSPDLIDSHYPHQTPPQLPFKGSEICSLVCLIVTFGHSSFALHCTHNIYCIVLYCIVFVLQTH